MLKIGEIAGFCGVPAKTLRYYNKIDLLKPHNIDPSTKYRLYDEDQIKIFGIYDYWSILFSWK